MDPRVPRAVRGSTRAASLLSGVLASTLSCSSYTPPRDTGGVTLGPGACGALLVSSTPSDWSSTSIAALGFDGAVKSATMLSSHSATTGLSAPFSGDTVVPTSATRAPEIVLIDRYPAAVLTWVDAASGRVQGQLSVQTGFSSNPYDYLQVAPEKAYVTRYDDNPKPGREPFDGGGDLLIVDPVKHAIEGRLDLHPALEDEGGSIQPRPSRMIEVDGRVYVLCAALSADFKTNGDSKIVTIDPSTDAVLDVTTLAGSHSCLGLAVSPDGSKLAVSCSGDFAGGNDPSLDTSALVVLDRTNGLAPIARVPATNFGGGSLGFSVTFATNEVVLFTTFGSATASPPRKDALVRSSLDGTDHATLLEDDPTAGFGEVRCEARCGACFAADGERAAVQRMAIEGSTISAPVPVTIRNDGLLPRYLGAIGAVN